VETPTTDGEDQSSTCQAQYPETTTLESISLPPLTSKSLETNPQVQSTNNLENCTSSGYTEHIHGAKPSYLNVRANPTKTQKNPKAQLVQHRQ